MQICTPGFKNHMRNLDNIRKAVKCPKSWNLTGYCLQNTFLQLKHVQRIYVALLSTTCVKIHQITYVFFTAQLLCIFLAQILHTFYKSSPSNCKFSAFPRLTWNQILHVIFQTKKSFFLQSLDLFSVLWMIILLYFFSWNFICHWQK